MVRVQPNTHLEGSFCSKTAHVGKEEKWRSRDLSVQLRRLDVDSRAKPWREEGGKQSGLEKRFIGLKIRRKANIRQDEQSQNLPGLPDDSTD